MANHPSRAREAALRRAYALEAVREAMRIALACGDLWVDLSQHDRDVYLSEAKSSLPQRDEMIAFGWFSKHGLTAAEFDTAMRALAKRLTQ